MGCCMDGSDLVIRGMNLNQYVDIAHTVESDDPVANDSVPDPMIQIEIARRNLQSNRDETKRQAEVASSQPRAPMIF